MDQFNAPGSVTRAVGKREIETLSHRYAVFAKDNAPLTQMAMLFRDNGHFRLPNGIAVKPAQMVDVVQGTEPNFIRHHITPTDIHFVSETEAHTEAYFFAVANLCSVDDWGKWKDKVTKASDGRWLIADRSIIVEGGDSKGCYKTNYS